MKTEPDPTTKTEAAPVANNDSESAPKAEADLVAIKIVMPNSTEGKLIVRHLASTASNAFVAQMSGAEDDSPNCDSVKSDLLRDLDRLDVDRSKDLYRAKFMLENGSCKDNLFGVTVYLRSASDTYLN
jgi:hypothetical protein